MSKNDWLAGDTGTRSAMNQPFWLASGVYNSGATRLEIQISPGSVRFPVTTGVAISKVPQQLLINNPQASRYYAIFVRSDGTFMVSGTTSSAVEPGPPRYNAENIGVVFTGASLSTANLRGPWNGISDVYPYEQRGQYVGISAARPRAIYDARVVSPYSAALGTINNSMTNSGISFLTFADPTQIAAMTVLMATVGWIPSGLLVTSTNSAGQPATNRLRVNPAFTFRTGDGTAIVSFYETVDFANDCLPDTNLGNRQAPQVTHCMALAPNASSAGGYRLETTLSDSSDPNISIRIYAVHFIAIPGHFASNLNEPT